MTAEAEESFEESKRCLAKTTLLVHSLENTKLFLKTDASNIAIGAIFEQFQDESYKPLGFFAKKLSESQQKYSTYDRELLAIYPV